MKSYCACGHHSADHFYFNGSRICGVLDCSCKAFKTGPRDPRGRKADPGLGQCYIKAFNATQSLKEAGKLLGVTGRAVGVYFARNGITVRKVATWEK